MIGALSQASNASDAANYNAQVATQNAQIVTQQGQADAIQQSRENYLKLSSIQAQQSQNGAGGSGSSLDVLGASAAQAELDVQNIRYNASLRALGYTNNANLDKSQASNAITTGLFSAAANGLSGYGGFLKTSNAGSGTIISSNPNSPGGSQTAL